MFPSNPKLHVGVSVQPTPQQELRPAIIAVQQLLWQHPSKLPSMTHLLGYLGVELIRESRACFLCWYCSYYCCCYCFPAESCFPLPALEILLIFFCRISNKHPPTRLFLSSCLLLPFFCLFNLKSRIVVAIT